MANKYYYTACLKKDDNGDVAMDKKRSKYSDAVKDLIELLNYNRTLGNSISFIGIIKHKANENPLDRIRDLDENLTLDVYTRIINAMDELRKKNGASIRAKGNGDYMYCKKVKYDCNITFDVEAYYDEYSFGLFEIRLPQSHWL